MISDGKLKSGKRKYGSKMKSKGVTSGMIYDDRMISLQLVNDAGGSAGVTQMLMARNTSGLAPSEQELLIDDKRHQSTENIKNKRSNNSFNRITAGKRSESDTDMVK